VCAPRVAGDAHAAPVAAQPAPLEPRGFVPPRPEIRTMTHSAHSGSRFSKHNSARRRRPAPPDAAARVHVEGLEERRLFALGVAPYNPIDPAAILSNAMLLPNTGITVTGTTYVGANQQGGTFTGFDLSSGRTRLAISDGVILTSGSSLGALPPNQNFPDTASSLDETTSLGTAGDPDLTALVGLGTTDANSLTLTFTTAPGIQSILFDFVFGSEEFPDFVGTFNDAFAVYLDGQQISFDANGEPITVNNNFFQLNNSGILPPPALGGDPDVIGKTPVSLAIEYDGLTPTIRTQAPVDPNLASHTLKFVISDTLDTFLDSGVFISRLQGSTTFVAGPVTDLPQPGVFNFEPVNYFVQENQLFATVTIVREQGLSGLVTVDVLTSDGSATGGVDYTTFPQTTLTFQDNQASQTVTIPLIDDAFAEGVEDFFISLVNPTNAAGVGLNGTAKVTIEDNELGAQFLQPVFSVTESTDPVTATITVVLTGKSSQTVTVDFATTAGGSATPNEDYTPVSGTLTFAPGVTSQTFTITIFDDFLVEPTETVNLTLSNINSPFIIGLVNPAVLEIVNLERPPTVTDAYFVTNERFTNGIALRFSESLTEQRAEDLKNYDLFIRKESKRLGGSPTRTRVNLASVVYEDISRTVTITSAKPLRDNKVYEVIVNTTRADGVESTQGDRLDGNYDNNVFFDPVTNEQLTDFDGDDFTGYLFRGTRHNYFDENGDKVGLALDGPGKFELFRTVERDARQLRMLETSQDTILNGTYEPVELTDNKATIRTLLTGSGFRNRLPLPPFIIQEIIPGLSKPNT
jgi:hypothetical protein